MDDNQIPRDERGSELNPSPLPENHAEAQPLQFMQIWDRLWAYFSKMGLGNVAMRVGSALVTLGLVGLVVWVMSGFFIPEKKASLAQQLPLIAGQQGPVELPSYEGAASVEGLSPASSAGTTSSAAPVNSRYDFTTYTVKQGDSVYSIAESYGLAPTSILWTNYETLLDNPAFIVPGQVLNIPPVDGVMWPWVKGNGLNKFSETLGVTPDVIIDWPGNNLSRDTIGDYTNPNITEGTKLFVPGGKRAFVDQFLVLIQRDTPAESAIWGEGKCAITDIGPVGTQTYVWPTTERRISGYEWTPDVGHYGIDIAGKKGNPIYAVDNGVVVYAGWSTWGYGNVIVIDHGDNMQTIYAHLDTIGVTCNESVYQGAEIGTMGTTGNSSGPHLHFEIRQGATRLNPHNYLGF